MLPRALVRRDFIRSEPELLEPFDELLDGIEITDLCAQSTVPLDARHECAGLL